MYAHFLYSNRLRKNRARLEGKPIIDFGIGNTIPSINPTVNTATCVNVGGGSSTSSSSASQGTSHLSGSHSLSTAGSSMVATSLLNGMPHHQQQNYSILIHYSLSDKPFVYDTLAPKMISDLTPRGEDSASLLLQNEKMMRQICFHQQSDTKSKEVNCIEKNLVSSESVIVVASEHYIKSNNNNNELKMITDKVCGTFKKPLVVIALDSTTAQTLRHTTTLKASNILVWGSPNFWQNVSRNLMTKYQTFNNNKSSPNKSKVMGSDDDEIWTYLKTNSEAVNRKNSDFSLENTNRLSMGTLKENMSHSRITNSHQNRDNNIYSFNFPSSTLQIGKRKQYLRGNPTPSSTPTSRRISHPDPSEPTSKISKSRSPNTSKIENQQKSLYQTKNVVENPFESHKFERFSNRKPPPYPNAQNHGVNSNSDSDYMSVNDSLVPRNEPIYHTLDDDHPQENHSAFSNSVKKHPDEDQKVYINSALEVVYPTESLLRQERKKLMELQRQHQYLQQKQRNYHGTKRLENEEEDVDDDDIDEEFNELLGGNVEDGFTTDDQEEDVYENGADDNSISYYSHGVIDQRKLSSASNNYVPSPAPGSYPRNISNVRGGSGFVAITDPYDNVRGVNESQRRAMYNQKVSKNGPNKGSYFV